MKTKNYKVAIFISDEGFGHVVRQRCIIEELLKKFKKIQITVITSKNILLLNEYFGNTINYINYDNGISSIKNHNGELNVEATKKVLNNWIKNHKKILLKFKKKFKDLDFIISDCVPEAFLLAKKIGCKSFGISHFTWDWYFEKVCKANKNKIDILKKYLRLADKFYFPPFTPIEILKRYSTKIKRVNFIVNNFSKKKKFISNKLKCLIMDNGTKNLSNNIDETIPYLKKIEKCIFYIGTYSLKKQTIRNIISSKNLVPVTGLKNMHSYIPHMDLIISRGGFNSISECLTLKKPAIFAREKNNLEVQDNIKQLTKRSLAGLIKQNDWKKNFSRRLDYFLTNEFSDIKKNLINSKFKSNGAQEVVNDIKKRINE
tara:strand:+ start:1645 stop:2763 length:1119 start_codon:yes stop_codon:yes gene_type:complete